MRQMLTLIRKSVGHIWQQTWSFAEKRSVPLNLGLERRRGIGGKQQQMRHIGRSVRGLKLVADTMIPWGLEPPEPKLLTLVTILLPWYWLNEDSLISSYEGD